MWIKHQAAADPDSPVGTERLVHEDYTNGEAVEFNDDTGKAQVTADVGEALVENYEDIVPADSDDDAATVAPSQADDDADEEADDE